MFRKPFPLVIVKNPVGTYGFVGSIPLELCEKISATKGGMLGGNVWKEKDGKYYEWKIPSFTTKQQAIDFCKSKGITNYDFPKKA